MNRPARPLALFLLLATASFGASAEKVPDCTHPEAWPASIAYVYLKNDGAFGTEIDKGGLAFDKKTVTRLASEKIGKDRVYGEDLYRQVHLVRFAWESRESRETVDVITVSEATNVECSMSDVDIYVISKRLGDYTPSGSVLREPQQQKTPKPKQK
ncbi:MAG: hypothetical protein LBU76_03750 [Azoarcus sp.]|jgi:hypothetical protein|nr:hypothetical protein [Azoarcus sp.]